MKQKVVSFSDAEMEWMKEEAKKLEITVTEFIRRLIAEEMEKKVEPKKAGE